MFSFIMRDKFTISTMPLARSQNDPKLEIGSDKFVAI